MKKIVLIISVSYLLITACDTGKTWEQIKEENTVESFRKFLQNHPETKHKDSIQILIAKLEWQKAKNANTQEALDLFLENYPENKTYIDSINILKLNMAWKLAEKNNTIEAYTKFLKDFHSNKYSNDAKQKIEVLSWENAKKINQNKEYLQFLANYNTKKYLDSLEKIGISFEPADFQGMNIDFEYGTDDENDIWEKIKLNFREKGQFDGTIEGFQESENYSNSWEAKVKGKYDESKFLSIQCQVLDQSDAYYEDEPENANWDECNMEYVKSKNAIFYKDRWYTISNISMDYFESED